MKRKLNKIFEELQKICNDNGVKSLNIGIDAGVKGSYVYMETKRGIARNKKNPQTTCCGEFSSKISLNDSFTKAFEQIHPIKKLKKL